MDKTEQLKLFAYLESLFDDKFGSIFTSQPATIKSFDAVQNTVVCTLDKEGITLEDIPISLFGNTQSYITTPTMEAGTKGLLIFSKHDLYIWIESGLDKEAKTDFSKNNAFFLIGATNHVNKITYNQNAIEIKTNKAVEITADVHTIIKAPKINLVNKATNEELFDLLVQSLTKCSELAQVLVSTHNLSGATPFIASFSALSSKFGGFK